MVCRYDIAGHLCDIAFLNAADDKALIQSFEPFESSREGTLLFKMTVDDAFQWQERGALVGQFDCGGNNFGVYKLAEGGYQLEIADENNNLCCKMQAGAGFADCKAALVTDDPCQRHFGLNNALMMAYAFASAPHGTLLMHSSVVQHDGKGYLFLGKSGTGKSTHSKLWLRYIPGTELMNDDNPVVRVQDDCVTVYGSPWSGKTPCYRNVSAPVGAFVQLHQHPDNVIRRARVVEGFGSLLPSISTMKWDYPVHSAHIDTISDILRLVPLYLLDCRPDEEAAQLSYHTLTGK